MFHDYLLSGNIDESLDAVIYEVTEILDNLEASFRKRYAPMVNDDFFTATAKFLDTESYIHVEFDDLYENVNVITKRFGELFTANGCDLDRLKGEFRILVSHVNKFLSKSSPNRCWPQLFKLKVGLGLRNILHIAELCIAIPLSNAESERVFSYLWRQLTKERMSLNHDTLENILQLRSSNNFEVESYDQAIDLFQLSVNIQMALCERGQDDLTDMNTPQKEKKLHQLEQQLNQSPNHRYFALMNF